MIKIRGPKGEPGGYEENFRPRYCKRGKTPWNKTPDEVSNQ